jgi:hypothetical protein
LKEFDVKANVRVISDFTSQQNLRAIAKNLERVYPVSLEAGFARHLQKIREMEVKRGAR